MVQATFDASRNGGASAYIAWYTLSRSMMVFFDRKQPPQYPNDILAVQYFDDPTKWRAAKGSLGSAPKEYKEARRTWANVLAAHLSYERIKFEGNSGVRPNKEITDYLWKLWETFLAQLTPERRKWFDDAHDPRNRTSKPSEPHR